MKKPTLKDVVLRHEAIRKNWVGKRVIVVFNKPVAIQGRVTEYRPTRALFISTKKGTVIIGDTQILNVEEL